MRPHDTIPGMSVDSTTTAEHRVARLEEALNEAADTDFDGKIDTWVTFTRGKVATVAVDRTRNGQADETRVYMGGKLSRVQRDSNDDGKTDIWEIYDDGKLQLMADHPLYAGIVPFWSPEVRATLDPFDVILAVGLPVLRLYIYKEPARPIPEHVRLIHLDDDPRQIGKNYPVEVGLIDLMALMGE